MANVKKTRKTVYAAVFLALGIFLPQAFHIFGAGSVFLPMHIPVIIAGFVVGGFWGMVVGVLSVILSSAVFSMPGFNPNGFSMIFELAAYGLFSGIMFDKVFKTKRYVARVYLSLISAMILGKIVAIIAKYIIFSAFGSAFAITMVLYSLFVTALPGIALQLVMIPPLMLALKNSKLIDKTLI